MLRRVMRSAPIVFVVACTGRSGFDPSLTDCVGPECEPALVGGHGCAGGTCAPRGLGEMCVENDDCQETCVAKRCAHDPTTGDACDDDDDCPSDHACHGQCLRTSGPCDDNDECVAACVAGGCREIQDTGGACDDAADCAPSNECVGGTCLLETGALCTGNDACAGVCLGGLCTAPSSERGPCEETDDCMASLECRWSLCRQLGWASVGGAELAPYTETVAWGSAAGGGLSKTDLPSVSTAVARGALGNPVVAWTQGRKNLETEIYLLQWDGTAWQELDGSASGGGVSQTAGGANGPRVAVSSGGVITVAWAQNDGPSNWVYLRQWDGSWQELAGSASGTGLGVDGDHSPALDLNDLENPVVAWTNGFDIDVVYWDGDSWEVHGTDIDGTADSSHMPEMIVDSAGVPVVVWQEGVGGSVGLFLRYGGAEIDGSATPPGISDTGEIGYAPKVVLDDTNQPIVVWHDTGGIRLRKVESGLWQASVALPPSETVSAGHARFLSVAWDGSAPVVGWVDERSSGDPSHILVHRYTGSWETYASSGTRPGTSPGARDSEDVALVMGPGGPMVAWSEGNSVGSANIYFRSFQAGAWQERPSASYEGGLGSPTAASITPAIALDRTGMPVIAWTEGKDIFVQRFTGLDWADYAGSGSGGGISNSSIQSLGARIGLDSLDRPTVIWRESGDILGRRWTGTRWEDLGDVSQGSVFIGGYDLNMDANGYPHVVWQNDDLALYDEQVLYRYWDGGSWQSLGGADSGYGVSNQIFGGAVRMPKIAVSGTTPTVAWADSGRVYLREWQGSWQEIQGSATGDGLGRVQTGLSIAEGPTVLWDSDGYEIHLKQFRSGAWEELDGSATDGGISDSGGHSQRPQLTLLSGGRLAVAWEDTSQGPTSIHLRIWDGAQWTEVAGSAQGMGISNSTAGPSNLDLAGLDQVCATWSEPASGFDRVFIRCH